MKTTITHALTILSCSFLLFSCGNKGEETMKAAHPEQKKNVLYSALAGRWYTDDKDELSAELNGYLQAADPKPLENVRAIMLPHAGFRYSGAVQAYGAKLIQGKQYTRVLVIGPTHRLRMPDAASVPDATHYGTPLGETPLDLEFIARLKKHPQFRTVKAAHIGENSTQIQFPMLQVALGDFKAVPIVVGQLDAESSKKLADVLLSEIDEHTLIVASTDFTHYGARFDYMPFKDHVAQNIEKLDMGAFRFIENKDPEGFYNYINKTHATICGRCSVGLLLSMLSDDMKVHFLKYDTSGNMEGHFENSVSYMAAAFTGDWELKEAKEPTVNDQTESLLDAKDKAQLLKLARGTIEYYMAHKKEPSPTDIGVEITPNMKQIMGCFVTLHKHGNLRGCIGEIFPRRELYKAVIDQAVNASVNDYRFSPLSAKELGEIDVEISALSPPAPVPSYEDIIIGKHGMVLKKGGRQAVFLPQVAPEQGWDLEETLTHLSRKAGLSPTAWNSGCDYLVFEAIVFGEKHGD